MTLKSGSALLLIAAATVLMTANAAAQPAQSHPLSEIYPIDTVLNMDDNAVTNVSKLVLDEGTEAEGLLLDDLTITHEGRAQKLVLDYQDDEWRIENADLNLDGNNISGFFGGPCPTGEFMVDITNNGSAGCISASGQVQDDFVNRDGDVMNGSLDMAGNELLGLKRVETSGNGVFITDSSGSYNLTTISEDGDIAVPRGGIDLQSGDVEGVRNLRLVGSSNNDQYTLVYDENNNRLALSNSGEDVLRFDDSTNDLILPGGGLDMKNSNIANFFGSACASGELMVQVNSDGTFECSDVTGEVQDDFVNIGGDVMEGAIDMNGWALEDNTGTLSLGGGDVEVASGDLDMNTGNIDNVGTLNSGGTTLNTGGPLDVGGGKVTSSSKMCIGDQC